MGTLTFNPSSEKAEVGVSLWLMSAWSTELVTEQEKKFQIKAKPIPVTTELNQTYFGYI